jgi:hypothetical protein
MGPIRCPETSVNNYHTTARNIPEERRSHVLKMFIYNEYPMTIFRIDLFCVTDECDRFMKQGNIFCEALVQRGVFVRYRIDTIQY